MSLFRLSAQDQLPPLRKGGRDDKQERLIKIEQKLQHISVQRQTQQKDDSQELLTRRVTQLETRAGEEMKEMEAKMRQIREQLSNLKLREGEMSRKSELNRKTRRIEIAQLQKQLVSALSFETHQRLQSDSSISKNMEEKLNTVAKEMVETQRSRMQEINSFEAHLERELPSTYLAIGSHHGQLEDKLEKVHKEIRGKTTGTREEMEREVAEQERVNKGTVELMGSVVDEIRKDLAEERRSREENKHKLLSLFDSASDRLSASTSSRQ